MTDDLTAILDHIWDGAESEITHPDDECGVEAGGFCTPHGALRSVAALRAVLELAGKLEPQGPPSSALEEDRMWIRQECADMIREAISREITGKEESGE